MKKILMIITMTALVLINTAQAEIDTVPMLGPISNSLLASEIKKEFRLPENSNIEVLDLRWSLRPMAYLGYVVTYGDERYFTLIFKVDSHRITCDVVLISEVLEVDNCKTPNARLNTDFAQIRLWNILDPNLESLN